MTDSQNNLHVLSTEDSESDLGILFKKNLKFESILIILLTKYIKS